MKKADTKATTMQSWHGTHYAVVIALLGLLVVTAALFGGADAVVL